jgi:hypothetical protein
MWDHKGFGQEWDKKGTIAEDLIAGPIRDFVEGELRAHGIDPDQRADMSQSSVDAFARAILDGPAGARAGLVGYTAADTDEAGREPKGALEDALALAAAGIATEALRTRVAEVTWGDVCFEIKDTLDVYEISNITVDEAVHIVGDAIGRVNYNCVSQWTKVYHIARREAGLSGKGD